MAKSIISKAMENNSSEKSFLGNTVIREERTTKSNANEVTNFMEINKVPFIITAGRPAMDKNTNDSLLTQKHKEDQLKLAKAEMGEVKEENERLKMFLGRVVKDYQSLQMHFFDILQQEDQAKPTDTAPIHQAKEEQELVSLSLGMTSSEPKKDDKIKNSNLSNGKEEEKLNGGLALGLDCRFEPSSTENMRISNSDDSSEELKEEEPTEIWPPSKILKTMRSGEDEVLQQSPLKKARVSVRARCDTPTMNDGCQWRKYGQKIAKGNPCPRAYYRCTVSPSCPVRRQVQRCAEDMSILITTYEGTHNHPLPISATAMASTTSAAASMIQSYSSTSQPGLGTSVTAPISSSTTTNNLHGLNFSLSQNSRPQQFYFPNSSFSTSNSHPTITLDLTAPSTSSPFGRFPPSFTSAPRYPSTCFNFSSSSSSFTEPNNTIPTPWNGYGALAYNRNQTGSLNTTGKQLFQDHVYQPPYMNNQIPTGSHQQSLKETISKAITLNPKFQSALAAALTSYVGNGGGPRGGSVRENLQGVGESSGLNLKWGDQSRMVNAIYPSGQNIIGCGPSYLNKSSSLNSPQQGGLALFPHSLQLSASNSASAASAAENRDHFKL